MKAVVAQIVGRQAVLLTENGTFVKVKNQRYRLGQQIAYFQKRRQLPKPIVMAASLVIFLLGGTFLAALRLPYSYVSIDVNPSIEYTLNWFDRVISLSAVNEDAKPLALQLEQVGVMNQSAETAIDMTIKGLDELKYFSDDAENDVVIAVASMGLKDVNGLSKRLQSSAGSALPDRPLNVTAFQTDSTKVQEAKQYHATAGKLVIVENLASGGDGLGNESKEEWLKKPVRDILSHKNGKGQTPTDDNKPEDKDQAMDDGLASGIPPGKSESQSPKPPVITDAPKKTDAPGQNQNRPNNENGKPADFTPNGKDPPKNTSAPKRTEQEHKTSAPQKNNNNGQEKERESNKPKK